MEWLSGGYAQACITEDGERFFSSDRADAPDSLDYARFLPLPSLSGVARK